MCVGRIKWNLDSVSSWTFEGQQGSWLEIKFLMAKRSSGDRSQGNRSREWSHEKVWSWHRPRYNYVVSPCIGIKYQLHTHATQKQDVPSPSECSSLPSFTPSPPSLPPWDFHSHPTFLFFFSINLSPQLQLTNPLPSTWYSHIKPPLHIHTYHILCTYIPPTYPFPNTTPTHPIPPQTYSTYPYPTYPASEYHPPLWKHLFTTIMGGSGHSSGHWRMSFIVQSTAAMKSGLRQNWMITLLRSLFIFITPIVLSLDLISWSYPFSGSRPFHGLLLITPISFTLFITCRLLSFTSVSPLFHFHLWCPITFHAPPCTAVCSLTL